MSVVVSGSFDDLSFQHVRFLDEAAKLGDLHVLLWADDVVRALDGKAPKFPVEEREYFVQAIRYVSKVTIIRSAFDRDALPRFDGPKPTTWVVDQAADNTAKKHFSQTNGLDYRVLADQLLATVPAVKPLTGQQRNTGKKKVLVTGCYDWLHSGHVRFFEEVSELGELYVCLGHDANIAALKGAGHPLFPQARRQYLVHAIRYVKEALVSSGDGWVDAEPEIKVIKPDMYAVNEDGDKPEKRQFCQRNNLQYVVLKRLPKPGLPRRQSTDLRGF